MRDPQLRTRVTTAIILGIVVIASTLIGQWAASLLVLVVTGGSCYEFFRMRAGSHQQADLAGFALCILPLLGFTAIFLQNVASILDQRPLLPVALISVLVAVYFLLRSRSTVEHTGEGLLSLAMASVLFTIPGVMGLYLCSLTPLLLLGIFILIWSSDTFAYFGGLALGRSALAPSVSPKKTWEGFLSGLVATMLVAWVIGMLITDISPQDWIVTGGLVAIFGTTGDLIQSTFKRMAGVKDSGRFLPGHGGFWDRFDSLMGCLPWIGLYFLMT